MVGYLLDDTGLPRVRFALSPLNELTLSLRALKDPGRYPVHRNWIRQVQRLGDRVKLPLLLDLVNDRLWTPDFLSPPARSAETSITDELAVLRRVDPATVRRDLAAVHDVRPSTLRGPTTRVRDRIADAMTALWTAAFEGYWRRVRAVLLADVTHRGRILATAGLTGALAGLPKTLALDGGVLLVSRRNEQWPGTVAAPEGVVFMPSVFVTTTVTLINAVPPPLVIYPARGTSVLGERRVATAPAALIDLIGRARATILSNLVEPTSSTELAQVLGVTLSAANQHLRALRAAGLLASVRHGRHVLYLRTELGDGLAGHTHRTTRT